MDRVWWSQVTNAAGFIRNIIDTMLEGTHLSLIIPGNIPWYDTMRESIELEIKKNDSIFSFDFIDKPQGEPGEYMMQNYCRKDKRAQYRPNISYAQFMAESEDIVLNNRYIWIRNIPVDKYENWISFVSEYNRYGKKRESSGVFVLEFVDVKGILPKRKGVKLISFHDEINEYDIYTFNAIIASNIRCNKNMKRYLAELSCGIGANDIELCAKCIERGEAFLKDPFKELEDILENESRSNGSRFCYRIEEHHIENQMWEAQIKIIFPVVEKFRSYFIGRYRRGIQSVLPVTTNYGERYESINEVEIGTLPYLIAFGKLHISDQDYENLILFRKARNVLAHMRLLALEDILALFEVIDKVNTE